MMGFVGSGRKTSVADFIMITTTEQLMIENCTKKKRKTKQEHSTTYLWAGKSQNVLQSFFSTSQQNHEKRNFSFTHILISSAEEAEMCEEEKHTPQK